MARIKNNYHLIIQRRNGTGCTTVVVDFGCIPVTSQGFIPESEKWERDELLKRKQNTSLLHTNVHLNLANFFILLETGCQLLAS